MACGDLVWGNKMKHTTFLAAIFLLTVPAHAAAPEFNQKAIDRLIESAMKEQEVPGVVAAVVVGDEVALVKAYGTTNFESKEALSADMVFDIASVTKAMTATLMIALEEDGTLSRHDKVADIIDPSDELGLRLGDMTLEDLASHRSGLPREPINRKDLPDSPTVMLPYTRAELYEALRTTPRLWAPGSSVNYSSFGMDLLGHTLEVAAGQPLEDVMRARLWAPLGMTATYVAEPPENAPRPVEHHWKWHSPRRVSPRTDSGEIWAGRGVTSNAYDLAKFVSLQFRAHAPDEDVISGQGLSEMHQPIGMISPDWDTKAGAYGLAWVVQPAPGNSKFVWHDGDADGHSAYVAAYPAEGLGLIVLANLGGVADEIGEGLLPLIYAPLNALRAEFGKALNKENWQGVADFSRELLSWNPNNRRASYWLGRAETEQGNCEQAAPHLTHARTAGMFPDYAAFYLSVCAARMGDFEQATLHMNDAFDLGFVEGERAEQYPALSALKGTRGYDLLIERFAH